MLTGKGVRFVGPMRRCGLIPRHVGPRVDDGVEAVLRMVGNVLAGPVRWGIPPPVSQECGHWLAVGEDCGHWWVVD